MVCFTNASNFINGWKSDKNFVRRITLFQKKEVLHTLQDIRTKIYRRISFIITKNFFESTLRNVFRHRLKVICSNCRNCYSNGKGQKCYQKKRKSTILSLSVISPSCGSCNWWCCRSWGGMGIDERGLFWGQFRKIKFKNSLPNAAHKLQNQRGDEEAQQNPLK